MCDSQSALIPQSLLSTWQKGSERDSEFFFFSSFSSLLKTSFIEDEQLRCWDFSQVAVRVMFT